MRRIVGKPSPAMVVALLALVIALGGTSYAAFSLAPDSVGTAQIKTGAVTPPKLAAAARPVSLFADTTQQFSGKTLGKLGPWTIKASCMNHAGATGLLVTASGPANTIGDGFVDAHAYSYNGATVQLANPLSQPGSTFGYHYSDLTLHSASYGSANVSLFEYAQGPSSFQCKVNAIGYAAPG